MTTPHTFLNPEGLLAGAGFSHVALPAAGQVVHLAGQTAHGPDGRIQGRTMTEQFEAAARNLVTALAAAGARPEHIVTMQIFVTDVADYRGSLDTIGPAWREHLGKHYPAVSLFGITELFDPDARIEIVCTAVIPAEREDR
jgi:enamine deaminase RidA (YjgF/YER057c/UK114 family)